MMRMLNALSEPQMPTMAGITSSHLQKKGKKAKKKPPIIESKISSIIRNNMAKYSSIITKILSELETVTKGSRKIQCAHKYPQISVASSSQSVDDSSRVDELDRVFYDDESSIYGKSQTSDSQDKGIFPTSFNSDDKSLLRENSKAFNFDEDILTKLDQSSRQLHQSRLAYITATLIELRDITAQLRREVPKSRLV